MPEFGLFQYSLIISLLRSRISYLVRFWTSGHVKHFDDDACLIIMQVFDEQGLEPAARMM
jgi:hypothetical protein